MWFALPLERICAQLRLRVISFYHNKCEQLLFVRLNSVWEGIMFLHFHIFLPFPTLWDVWWLKMFDFVLACFSLRLLNCTFGVASCCSYLVLVIGFLVSYLSFMMHSPSFFLFNVLDWRRAWRYIWPCGPLFPPKVCTLCFPWFITFELLHLFALAQVLKGSLWSRIDLRIKFHQTLLYNEMSQVILSFCLKLSLSTPWKTLYVL